MGRDFEWGNIDFQVDRKKNIGGQNRIQHTWIGGYMVLNREKRRRNARERRKTIEKNSSVLDCVNLTLLSIIKVMLLNRDRKQIKTILTIVLPAKESENFSNKLYFLHYSR